MNRKLHLYVPKDINLNDAAIQFEQYASRRNLKLGKHTKNIVLWLSKTLSYFYFCYLRNHMFGRVDDSFCVNSTALRQFVGYHSSSIVDFLANECRPKCIVKTKNYKVGNNSNMFRFSESVAKMQFVPAININQESIAKAHAKLIAYHRNHKEDNRYPLPQLRSMAAKISVDDSKIESALTAYVARKQANNEAYNLCDVRNRLDILCSGQRHGSYFFTRPNGSRLYSSITGCPKEIRSLFVYNGEPFVELDQCASQPFLLLRFYQHLKSASARAEADSYYDLWNLTRNNGDFYTNLIGDCDAPCRAQVKKALINNVLNNNDDYVLADKEQETLRRRIEAVLSSQFPILYNEIQALKTHRRSEIRLKNNRVHCQFAVQLQKMESEVFIDRIAAECVSRDILIYTVHDCIGCLPRDKGSVMEIAVRHLRDFCGYTPRFK